MKRIFLALFVAGIFATSFTSCREKKTFGDEVEDVADDVEDAVD